MRRYSRSTIIKGGTQFGSNVISRSIFDAVESGQIITEIHVMQQSERLDILAGQFYDDSSLWWIIAAASGIGWGLQVPPGTVIRIPTDLNAINSLIS